MRNEPGPGGMRALVAIAVLAVVAVVGPGIAVAAPPAVVSPSSYSFADRSLHDENYETAHFDVDGTTGDTYDPVTIVGADADEFAVVNDGCGGGPPCAVDVQFRPTRVGELSATMVVSGSAGDTNVALDGTGVVGQLTADPPSLVFTPQPYYYGGGQQVGFNVWNNTSNVVQSTSWVISGPDAAHFYLAYGSNCANQTYFPGNGCGLGVGFNPDTNHPGTYTATLTLANDGVGGDLAIPLSGVTLSGPHTTVPEQIAFGNVETGSEATQIVPIGNNGDSPMQIQQALTITSHPDVWFATDDTCPALIVMPGERCTVKIHFRPSTVGPDNAVFFVINGNGQSPVNSIGLTGSGSAPGGPASGSTPGTEDSPGASVRGQFVAGATIDCGASGPQGSNPSYSWTAYGTPIPGATSSTLTLTDRDVGARIACVISAGSATATSTISPPIRARDLSDLPGAFVDPGTARRVDGPSRLRVGATTVRLSGGGPASPGRTYRVEASSRVTAAIDGVIIGAGRSISLSPRDLARFPDGRHTLTLSRSGKTTRAAILLSPATLVVEASGSSGRASSIAVSGRTGLGTLRVTLPKSLVLHARTGSLLGSVDYTSAATPQRSLDLVGARTTTNGVSVVLGRRTITVSNLPPETGVVAITLLAGVVTGHGGRTTARTTLRGDTTKTLVSGMARWTR